MKGLPGKNALAYCVIAAAKCFIGSVPDETFLMISFETFVFDSTLPSTSDFQSGSASFGRKTFDRQTFFIDTSVIKSFGRKTFA
jgi:hypothetical protein